VKLIVAVIRDEYAAVLTENLLKSGYSATKLASTGGFLRSGNSTFLVGVPAEQEQAVLEIIRVSCPATKSVKGDPALAEGALKAAGALPGSPPPAEIKVGGATVFVLGVERMVKV
jgi:uncharacterized protein YaaQ